MSFLDRMKDKILKGIKEVAAELDQESLEALVESVIDDTIEGIRGTLEEEEDSPVGAPEGNNILDYKPAKETPTLDGVGNPKTDKSL